MHRLFEVSFPLLFTPTEVLWRQRMCENDRYWLLLEVAVQNVHVGSLEQFIVLVWIRGSREVKQYSRCLRRLFQEHNAYPSQSKGLEMVSSVMNWPASSGWEFNPYRGRNYMKKQLIFGIWNVRTLMNRGDS